MVNTNDKVRREVRLWIRLFFISIIAAVVIDVIFETVRSTSNAESGDLNAGVDLNFNGMLSSLWYEHYRWCLGIFAMLCVVRLLFLFLASRANQNYELK
jgi:hypothetical protein